MKKDNARLKRKMETFEQTTKFETNDPVDAYHVAILKDRGFVDASLTPDSLGTPSKAVIGRITARGYDALEEERLGPVSYASDWHDDDWLMAYWKDLLHISFESQSFHDHLISTVATGAIALAFVIAKELGWKDWHDVSGLWLTSVVSWVLSLAFVLTSTHTATYKSRKCSELIAAGKRELSDAFSQKYTWTWWLNICSSIALVLGIVLFGIFIIRVLNQ